MTDVDDAIERAENDEEYTVSFADGRTYQQVLFDDRAALAAEVKRLRAQEAAVEAVAAEHSADLGGGKCVCAFCRALASREQAQP